MKKSYNVISDHEGMRIDRWIKKNIYSLPQSLLEKMLRSGKIKVNKKKIKSNFKIKCNDIIDIFNVKFEESLNKEKFKPSKKLLKKNEKDIIFDNDDYIVLNKKTGISVQSGTKSFKNLVDIYAKSVHFKNSKPYTVHRLDKDTSGILILAKNRKTAQLFTSLFRIRKIHKTYLAICHGEININDGVWNNKLIRYDKDKKIIEEAITHYKVIDSNSKYSLIECKPITGRKHQLRKQTSLSGFSIVGDKKYNSSKSNKNLMLHAVGIKFKINNIKYNYTAPLPEYFTKFLKSNYLDYPNY